MRRATRIYRRFASEWFPTDGICFKAPATMWRARTGQRVTALTANSRILSVDAGQTTMEHFVKVKIDQITFIVNNYGKKLF